MHSVVLPTLDVHADDPVLPLGGRRRDWNNVGTSSDIDGDKIGVIHTQCYGSIGCRGEVAQVELERGQTRSNEFEARSSPPSYIAFTQYDDPAIFFGQLTRFPEQHPIDRACAAAGCRGE
jgi:hypothetical protein